MMKFAMSKLRFAPLLVLGTIIGALGMAPPAQAQDATPNPIYDQFNNAKVAYVRNEAEFSHAIDLLTKLPGNQSPSVIRFIQPGIYHLANVNNVLGSISYSIEGPGSFYMDPTFGNNGQNFPNAMDAYDGKRIIEYGVTIVGGINPEDIDNGDPSTSSFYRFIKVDSGQTINLSGLTLMNFGRYTGDGATWKDSQFKPSSWGGTIINAGTMTLTNITILNSRAIGYKSSIKATGTAPSIKYDADPDRQGGSALGGAIYNSGSLTMRGCSILNSSAQTVAFDNGTAALGGGVYSTGSLDIANCTFDSNHVYGNREFDGQGNYYGEYSLPANTHGAQLIAGGRVVGGGGIAIDGGANTIQNITVTNNTAEGGLAETKTDGVFGAGIYWKSGYTNPYSSVFAGNRMEQSTFNRPNETLFNVQQYASDNGATNGLVYIGNGVRPEFQHANSTNHTNQFAAVTSNPIGPNTAHETTGDYSSGNDLFLWGYGGHHNLGGDISYLNYYFTPLQDNGGQTLTRAPSNVKENVYPVPSPNDPAYDTYYYNSPVDNGSIPHTGADDVAIANYLAGVDQRGAKRVVHGRDPDSIDTSQGATVVDVGAVEARFEPVTHNLIKEGGNAAPFIIHDDSGITDADNTPFPSDNTGDPEDDGGPNKDIGGKDGNGDPTGITGIQIRDADEYGSATSHIVEVTIDFPDGAIVTDFSKYPGITVVSVDKDRHTVVIRGTIADINAALAQGLLLERSDAQVDYPPDFSITVNDLGNYGYGGDQIYSDITTHELIDPAFNPAIYIQPVNHRPNISAPGSAFVKKSTGSSDYTTLVFSRDNHNSIYVSDPDINAPIQNGQGADLPAGYDRSGLHMQVTLTTTNGSLSLGNSSAVTIVGSGKNGNGGVTVTFEGTPTALNAALEGLSYSPNPNITSDTLQVVVNDLGNYGQGGPLTATHNITIKATADGKDDGSGGNNNNSGTIRWEMTDGPTFNTNSVEVTYTLTNLSNTDITNIVASGSIAGGAYFDTSNVTFSPSVGSGDDVRYQFSSTKLQRDLDPSKNGISVTWGLVDNQGNPYVLRQGRNVFIRITIPASASAVGQKATGSWSVSFTPVDPQGNASNPGPTPSGTVH